MSAPESTGTCSTCGGPLPAGSRFCPDCGGHVAGQTVMDAVPPPETGDVPIARFRSSRTGILLGSAAVVLAAAIALFALGHWIGGPVLLGISAGLLALYAGDSAQPRETPPWVHASRNRARSLATRFRTRAGSQRELLSLRLDVRALRSERNDRLHTLGEAVVAGDEERVAAIRAAVEELDRRIAAKEEEMSQTSERAQDQVARARLESSSTQLLQPPEPAPPSPAPPAVPEPYPPPDEGTPPTPEPVPEPYPPPDEGDPPQPP